MRANRVEGPVSVPVCIRFGFQDFQFEMDFLAPHKGIEVLLPELPQKAKTSIALVQIDQKLYSEGFPDIEHCDTAAALAKSHVGVEGIDRGFVREISKRVAVEVIAVCEVGSEIRVGPVRCHQTKQAPGTGNPVEFAHHGSGICDMFDDMTAHDFIKAVIRKRVRNVVKIVNNVRRSSRVDVHSDCSRDLVFSATDIQDTKVGEILFWKSIELGGFHVLV